MHNAPAAVALFLLFAMAVVGCAKSDEAEKAFQEGNHLFAQQRIEGAAKAYTEALAKDKNHVGAQLMMGRMLYYQREFEQAERAVQRALDQDPANSDARYWLAKLQSLDPKRAQAALGNLDLVLSRDAKHTEALLLKGSLHEKRKEIGQALAAYNAAVEGERSIAHAYQRLAALYAQADMKDQAAMAAKRAGAILGTDVLKTEKE